MKGTQTLYGVVTDDDGTVQSFEYSDDNGTTWHSKGTSSWSITDIPEKPDNTLLFKVIDAKGTTFITTAENSLSRPNVTDGTTPVSGNLTFGVVVNKPDYRNVEFYKFDATQTTNQWTEFDPVNDTVGGLRYTKVKVQLEAKSSAFINEITASYNSNSHDFTCVDTDYQDGTWHVWNSEEITLGTAESLHGKQSLDITIKDTVDFTNQIKEEITLDNKAPTIDISRPSNLIGQEETIRGSVNETSTLYYAVSRYCQMKSGGTGKPDIPDETKPYSILSTASVNVIPGDSEKTNNGIVLATAWKQLENNDSDSSWYVYFDAQYRAGSTTEFETDHTDKLGTYLTEDYLKITSKADVKDSKYGAETPVYFWLKAVDACGNIAIKEQKLEVDPQGERPRVEITYPTNEDKNGVSTPPTLGGTIRMTGTAEDNNAAKYAWIQIDRDGNGFSKDDLQHLKNNGYSIGQISTNTKLNSVPSSIGTGANAASDYGVWVEVKGSGWSLPINENQEFNPDSGKANLHITVCATDADEPPHVSLPRSQIVEIDAETPYSESLRLVNYETNASMSYSDGANISGIWYLTGKFIDDDSGIGSIKYKGNEVISGNPDSNGKFFPVSGDTNTWFKRITHTVGTDTLYDYEFSVPLGKAKTDSTKVGSDSVSFVVQENTSQKLSISPVYTITFDNKAPVLNTETTNDNVSLERNVQNSSGFYYFGAIASEEDENNVAQSGVERIAFYFTRDLTYGLRTGTTETHDLFDVMICHENTDDEDTGSGNMITNYANTTASWVKEDGLYWHKVTGATISDTSVTIGTANNNIHKRGIAKINGVIYLIEGVNGNTITLDKAPGNSTSADVLFAVCNVIDKSGKNGNSIQTTHGYGYGYYESRANDDGDRITETFNKQGTDWIFDAAINSKNLPDGPITLHLVAFDKAGNIAEWSSPAATEANKDTFFVVSNNAPRIAGMFIGTDENGDGSVTGNVDFTTHTSDSGEFISYHNIYTKGYDKQNNAKTDVTFPEQNGDTPASAITVKGKTVIKPEIVGGNGSISYSYSVYNHSSGLTWQTEKEYSSNGIEIISVGTTDDSIAQMKSGVEGIVLNVADFVQKTNNVEHISDGNYKKFTFSFSDSTPGYLATSNSSNSATMNVIMNVDLRDSEAAKNFILPFYWTSSSINSLFKQDTAEGHIEIAKDWVLSNGYVANNAEFDADPKVSGKIKIEGIASDNILLKNITVNFNKAITGFAATDTDVTLATYSGGSWTPASGHALTASGDLPTDASWAVSVEKATYGQLRKLPSGTFDLSGDTEKADNTEVPESSQKYGHVVHWTLYIDTAKLSTIVDTDLLATAKAADRGSPSWNGTAVEYGSTTVAVTNSDKISGAVTVSGTSVSEGDLSGKYQMDVVPYITGVETDIAEEFARAASGAYTVYYDLNKTSNKGETITINGFNLVRYNGTANVKPTVTVGEGTGAKNLTVGTYNANAVKATITSDTPSSKLKLVSSTGCETLNNINKNPTFVDGVTTMTESSHYNSQANGTNNDRLTDDVELKVWELDNFVNTADINTPMMKMDSASNWYMSYGYKYPSMYVNKNGETTEVDYSYNKFHNTNVAFDSDGNIYALSTNTDRVGNTAAKFSLYSRAVLDENPQSSDYQGPLAGKSRLEMVYNEANDGIYDINRVQRPKITVLGNTSNTKVFITYFDHNSKDKAVKFRYGTINGSNTSSGQIADTAYSSFQTVANNTSDHQGGAYAAVGVVPSGVGGAPRDIAVVAWYDADAKQLVYSYNDNSDLKSSVGTGTDSNIWQQNAKIVGSTYDGWYVDMAVDGNGGIHLAFYTTGTGDLKYAYIPKYSSSASEIKVVTVDSYQSVGTQISINVREDSTGNYVPYISYYNGSLDQTQNSVRVAWRTSTMAALGNGVGIDSRNKPTDRATGLWEYMTVPCTSIPDNAVICNGVPKTGDYGGKVVLGFKTDEKYVRAILR